MGLVNPSYDGFFYMCGKAILMCLIPILEGVSYDGIICSKTPFKGLTPIN